MIPKGRNKTSTGPEIELTATETKHRIANVSTTENTNALLIELSELKFNVKDLTADVSVLRGIVGSVTDQLYRTHFSMTQGRGRDLLYGYGLPK